MLNARVKCPYCQAPNQVDYKKKKWGCRVCRQTFLMKDAEIIDPPKEEEIYDSSYDKDGNKLPHTVLEMTLIAMLLGSFGIDYFIYKKFAKGLLCILFIWTAVPFVLGIFRGFELMALEPDQLQSYYDKKGKF